MWYTSVKEYLRMYNAFPERKLNDGNDEDRIRTQIISTRIYLILLFTFLFTIVLVQSLAFDTIQLNIIEDPSIQQFNALNNPQCLCSNVAIPYSVFVAIEPRFHIICSSDFVTNRWINFLYQENTSVLYYPFDFRKSASSQFQALASFCDISQMVVKENLAQFLATQLISIQVISVSTLQSQVQAAFDEFKLNILSLFSRQRYMIQQIIANNQLLSGLQTNFIGYYYFFPGFSAAFANVNRFMYQQTENSPICLCRYGNCQLFSGIYEPINTSILLRDYQYMRPYLSNLQMSIPGFVASCYPIQSILLSTLECFYDQSCVDNLTSFIPFEAADNYSRSYFTALTTSNNNSDVLTLNRTVDTLLNNLMVETWTITNMSFENYYNTCAAASCTFSRVERKSFLNVFTVLLSCYGGLTIVLRILVPRIVKRVRRRQNPQPLSPKPKSGKYRFLKDKMVSLEKHQL